MFSTKINRQDLFPCLIVLALALCFLLLPLLWEEEGQTLLLSTPEGSYTYALDTDRDIELQSNNIKLKIVIRDGQAFVSESNCPDGVCVASGKLSKSGETLICAPAGVRLLIQGGDDDVDFVAG